MPDSKPPTAAQVAALQKRVKMLEAKLEALADALRPHLSGEVVAAICGE